ncbi:Fic family protein [Catenovulum agarivorans DS-2]|uniref:Fic family protein n=1 Tax=Catenovulum agarivorans DS-2 TaxID=1328313 RepID=W7Q5N3_9ALTE|nr:Fic family protein [Catenovulum agarivorans]EWH08084.1 Fic family protein [Catenovulum agarivorans DS-2]
MKPVGYSFLNSYYTLTLPKLGLEVYQDPNSDKGYTQTFGASNRKVLSKFNGISESPYEQMVAAIKHQGIRLHFFAAIFKVVDVVEFTNFIQQKPNSKYNRVLWYLYEWITDKKLELPDLKSGNYINLFEDEFYYTVHNGEKDKRTKVINNAIGTRDFCPTVRKTPHIKELAKINVYETAYAEVQKLGEYLSADVLSRSINYLYTKETKSSTEIEREKPDKQKMQRFLNSLKNIGLFALDKSKLIDVQNQIVEDSAKATDYRTCEVYVGSTIQRFGFIDEDVHYIGAKAEHVHSMMDGLFKTHERLMLDNNMPALIHATVISFGEVYIHPFDDGNGRIHRYLIHDVMKQREPEHKFIIPISAAILKNTAKYDQVLESISKPLMSMLRYDLDSENNNTVVIHNDIDYMYRYPDYTEHVQFVYEMMNAAISTELVEEIALIITFDEIKKSINKIADIPNAQLDKIVGIIINGKGVVSKSKQAFVNQYIDKNRLETVQQQATSIISYIEKTIKIDVQKMMSK